MGNATGNRHCDFYKASDGQWYMNYSPSNGDYQDSDCYGPFPSFKEAFAYMSKHLPNPGAWSKDITGRKSPPKRAPNGSAVKHVAPRKRKAAASDDRKFSVGDVVTVPVQFVERNTGRKVWQDVKKKILNVYPPTFSGSDWQYSVQDINAPDTVSTVTQESLLAQNEPTNKTANLEEAWGAPVYRYGAFSVRVPAIRADIDMQVRSLRRPQTPTRVPRVIVEGILRFKIGIGERAAIIVQFDVVQDDTGYLIDNVEAKGLTGVQVDYVLGAIIGPLLPMITARAVEEGLLQ